jgi:hypothetical protein
MSVSISLISTYLAKGICKRAAGSEGVVTVSAAVNCCCKLQVASLRSEDVLELRDTFFQRLGIPSIQVWPGAVYLTSVSLIVLESS